MRLTNSGGRPPVNWFWLRLSSSKRERSPNPGGIFPGQLVLAQVEYRQDGRDCAIRAGFSPVSAFSSVFRRVNWERLPNSGGSFPFSRLSLTPR